MCTHQSTVSVPGAAVASAQARIHCNARFPHFLAEQNQIQTAAVFPSASMDLDETLFTESVIL